MLRSVKQLLSIALHVGGDNTRKQGSIRRDYGRQWGRGDLTKTAFTRRWNNSFTRTTFWDAGLASFKDVRLQYVCI